MHFGILKLLRSSMFKIVGQWSNSIKEISDNKISTPSIQGTLLANNGHYYLRLLYSSKSGQMPNISVFNKRIYGYGTICNSKIGYMPVCVILIGVHTDNTNRRKSGTFEGPLGVSIMTTYKIDYVEIINSPELNNFVSNDMQVYLTNLSQFCIDFLFNPEFDVKNDAQNGKMLNVSKYLGNDVISLFPLNENNSQQECFLNHSYTFKYLSKFTSGTFNFRDTYRINFTNISLRQCYGYRHKLVQWFSLLNGHSENDYKCIIYSGLNDKLLRMKDVMNLMKYSNTKLNPHDNYNCLEGYPFGYYRNVKYKMIKNIFHSLKNWFKNYANFIHVYNCLNLTNIGKTDQQFQKISDAGEDINDYMLDKKVKKGTEKKIKHSISIMKSNKISRQIIIVLGMSLDLEHTKICPKYLHYLVSYLKIDKDISKIVLKVMIVKIKNILKLYHNILLANLYYLTDMDKYKSEIQNLCNKCKSYRKKLSSNIGYFMKLLREDKLSNKNISHGLSDNKKMFEHPISEYMFCLRTNLSHPQTNGEIIQLLQDKKQSKLILNGMKLLIRSELLIGIGLNDDSVKLLTYKSLRSLIKSLIKISQKGA